MTIEQGLPEGYKSSEDGTHAVFTKPIEMSQSDERSYRLIMLKNEMEVFLIHDPDTDMSAATMNVHVGNSSDPDNLQGLAHFLEHLLFQGTSKYPRANEYKEYLSLHSGQCNAATSIDNTNYFFEIGDGHLEGALDRFSQFFISPLFDESCQEREVNAVDSEFKSKIQDDDRRLLCLERHLSSRQNPYWHFSTGNLTTLKESPAQEGINVRDELIKFYHQHYSSNVMKLVILGKEPLDVLASLAIEKFSEVKNLGIQRNAFPSPPWTAEELMIKIYAEPMKDRKTLLIKYPFPSQGQHYTLKPLTFISHLIGDEGSGSLLSLLKRKGWANGVKAGSRVPVLGYEFFTISIDLTKEGLVHHDDVIVVVFQYIAMLRQKGYEAHNWDEYVSLESMAFRFKDKQRNVPYMREIAATMQKGYAPETILSGDYLVRGSDPQLIMDCINELRIDNWRAVVVSQDPAIVPGGAFTEAERLYGIKYHVDQVSPTFMDQLQHLELHEELHLPLQNEYIPKAFETSRTTTPVPLEHPALIKHTPLIRLWHKKDDIFWVPKVNIFFRLYSPLAVSSPGNLAKSLLFVALVNDTLNEEVYSAVRAGLSYSLKSSMDGIIIEVQGYNDKANVLLNKVILAMMAMESNPEQFRRIKDRVERVLRDRNIGNPDAHASYYTNYMNAEKTWMYQEILEGLEHVTLEDVQRFYPEMLSRLHIEGLVHGNMGRAQAMQAGDIVEARLKAKAVFPSELIPARSTLLAEGYRGVYECQVPDPNNLNSAVGYHVQIENHPSNAIAARKTGQVLVQILIQIIREPCFNQLRTIEQLGYRVFTLHGKYSNTAGISIFAQSERDPVHLEQRIEEFLKTRIAGVLETMSEAGFQKQVQSLRQKRLEKDKNLAQESKRYWEHIISGHYYFNQIKEEVEEMESITLEQIRRFFQEWFMPDSPRMQKMSVHMRSQKLVAEDLQLKEGTVMVKDIVEFKAGLELSRAPCPTVELAHYVEPGDAELDA